MQITTGAALEMGNVARLMIGILLMVLTAILAIALGQSALDTLLARRIRIPVRSDGSEDRANSLEQAE